MIDLLKTCGLPVQLDETGPRLVLQRPVLGETPVERQLEELRPVLHDQALQQPPTLYTLHNDVGIKEGRDRLLRSGLRYDLAVMPPLILGQEYVKTIGHYHSACRQTGARYAEVYEVVHGRARFILQRQDADDAGIVEEILWLEAEKGDRPVMSPDYAHVTINPGPETLVLANLVARACEADYSRIVEMSGFGYFCVQSGSAGRFVQNAAYRHLPPIRETSVTDLSGFEIRPDQPIYTSALSEPARFRFLVEPHRFPGLSGATS